MIWGVSMTIYVSKGVIRLKYLPSNWKKTLWYVVNNIPREHEICGLESAEFEPHPLGLKFRIEYGNACEHDISKQLRIFAEKLGGEIEPLYDP